MGIVGRGYNLQRINAGVLMNRSLSRRIRAVIRRSFLRSSASGEARRVNHVSIWVTSQCPKLLMKWREKGCSTLMIFEYVFVLAK